jgi:ankyrin repeat protein
MMKNRAVKMLMPIIVVFALLLVLAVAFRLLPANNRGRLFLEAVERGHSTTARMLVHLGADPNFITCSDSAMHYAASIGDVDFLRFLVRHGASIDQPLKFGETPLYEARLNHQTDAEPFLLAHGANPDTSHIHPP